jgi:hypothetical protein
MNANVRKLILGLAVVLVSLTGLLAVSALVPDVSCQKRTPDILETATRIHVWLPERTLVGQPFTVNGILERAAFPGVALPPLGGNEKYAEPFPQQRVIIKSSFFSEETVTDDQGRFSCNITPMVPGNYLVTAKYPGDSLMYYRDSAAGSEVEFIGEETVVNPVDLPWLRYVVGIPILLLGAYVVYRYLRSFSRRGREERGPRKRRQRWQELRDLLPWVLAMLVMAAILYALVPRGPATRRQGEDTNRITTSIRITVPSRVDQRESFEVKGRLHYFQGDSGWPMRDAKIDIFVVATSGQFGVQEIVATLTTDKDGRFSSEIAIDYSGLYEVSAVFRDTGETYLESGDVRNVRVGGPGEVFGDWKSPGWFPVILGVPMAILVAIAAFLYYRHYRKAHPPELKKPQAPAVVPAAQPPTSLGRAPSADSPVKITFPQIAEPFPDVWGQDDNLLIVFTVDGTRYPLAQLSLDVELGPDSTIREPLGQPARVSHEHTYRRPGDYQIKAAPVEEVRNGFVPASRMVRIVDYREEIVRLYSEMVRILRARGVALSTRMTAREVENRLVGSMPNLSRDAVTGLVSVFEEANYSLHSISRSSYEKMYLALTEVEKTALGGKSEVGKQEEPND